ncbi:MAG TPA: transcription antitermination factor NusB [Thermodesulfobacteriota bacterium]|nr:transcription antitermination factor NusB [Thermodesulfobacteriota bacterium]
MGRRRKSRESALQVLYQLNITKQDATTALARFQEHFSSQGEADDFLKRLVLGVLEHVSELDRLIEKYSENWRLDRINMIDRTILRIALFELLYCEEIPPKVTINEAIDLGKRFGSEDSGSFINGILDRIQNEAVKKPVEPKAAGRG